ncbi:MAG: TetR/AcrR family transcriptional regulator [Clostridiales bacterium]|nr:TetR/AcrR family transcriptional regulator [Clostridiales bacterium]
MSTRESAEVREVEILNACEKLYEKMNFRDVTIKEISAETSCSRPSIYNYFQTKEEIFLRLFEREYMLWCDELEMIGADELKAGELAERLARSLEKRELMLKLLAVNLYDMEENSRIERLISFKKAYGRSIVLFDEILKKAFPDKTDTERRQTLLTAMQFLHGVYPYSHATPKQIEAMDAVGIRHDNGNIYELSLVGLKMILK